MSNSNENIEIINNLFNTSLQNINYILIQKQDDIVNLHTNVCFYFSQKKISDFISTYNIQIIIKEQLNEHLKKHSNIVFLDNEISENVIYKKYELNNKIYFFQLDKYNETVFDLRRKSYFQVCEALGVKKIIYSITETNDSEYDVGAELKIQNNGLDGDYKHTKKNNNSNILVSTYNKIFTKYISYEPHELENEIKSPLSYFLISELDFENDFNLRCLIRSRLNGNLISSNLEFKISSIDSNDISLGLEFWSSNKNKIKFKNLKSKNKVLNMMVEFYPLDELISSDNVKYSSSNSIEKNKRLFELLKLRLNYDLQNISKNINYDPFNYIENYLQQYLSSKNYNPTIKSNLQLLKILNYTKYSEIISRIDSYYDIEDVLYQLEFISLDKYLIINSAAVAAVVDPENNKIFNYVKDILTSYFFKSKKSSTDLENLVEYKLLISFLSSVHFRISKNFNKNDTQTNNTIFNSIRNINTYEEFVSYLGKL